VYRDLLEFIGLDDDGRTEFKPKSAHREFERAWMQAYLMNPPSPIARLLEFWDRRGWEVPGAYRSLRKLVKHRNTREVLRPPLAGPMREMLRTNFASDVQRLSHLLRRDLGHWL
jgi:hypothetical protein